MVLHGEVCSRWSCPPLAAHRVKPQAVYKSANKAWLLQSLTFNAMMTDRAGEQRVYTSVRFVRVR